jgi:hypothetical protein
VAATGRFGLRWHPGQDGTKPWHFSRYENVKAGPPLALVKLLKVFDRATPTCWTKSGCRS